MRRGAISITVVLGVIIFLIVGAITMVLFFAGSGLFPRVAQVLTKTGIIDLNASVEEPPPLFDTSPQVIKQRREEILGEDHTYEIEFQGELELSSRWYELDKTAEFRVIERFEDGVPTGERDPFPSHGDITDGPSDAEEREIWQINELTQGKITLFFQREGDTVQTWKSFTPSDEESRHMLAWPYELSTGETVPIDIAELRYFGLSENERRIRYQIVPSYSQESIQS